MNAFNQSLEFQPQQDQQMALALAAQLRAEIEAQCLMAERNPRDWDRVREAILRECKRSSFAEVARYSVPRGEKKIAGFSIRFAEMAIQAARHVHVTVRTIWENDEQRKLLVKVIDAETMVSYSDEITLEKTIERRSIRDGQEVLRTRKNKSGDQLYVIKATEDDLLSKQNAIRSKSIRSSGLRLIPGWIQEQALHQIRETLATEDKKNPDAAKQKLFDSFAELGVSVVDLKTVLGHEAAVIEPKEMEMLRGLYVAIREKDITIKEFIEKIEKAKQDELDRDKAANKGAVGEVVNMAGDTVKSVREKILNRSKKTEPTTEDAK